MRLFACLLLASITPLAAQQAPTVRLIAAPDASSKQTLGVVTAVRQLPNGALLVNDVLAVSPRSCASSWRLRKRLNAVSDWPTTWSML